MSKQTKVCLVILNISHNQKNACKSSQERLCTISYLALIIKIKRRQFNICHKVAVLPLRQHRRAAS
jgi:hypothetical protein